MQMTCDADCTREGWKEFYAYADMGTELHISAPANADFDGAFRAFDHDEQEMITVYGWNFILEPVEG